MKYAERMDELIKFNDPISLFIKKIKYLKHNKLVAVRYISYSRKRKKKNPVILYLPYPEKDFPSLQY